MIVLFFEGIDGRLWKYTILSYTIDEDGFYCFQDIKDGKHRKLHKSLLRGIEEMKP